MTLTDVYRHLDNNLFAKELEMINILLQNICLNSHRIANRDLIMEYEKAQGVLTKIVTVHGTEN